MIVKVDYSPKAKALGNDNTIPGCYAIYYKKHWYNKWKMLDQTYADFDFAVFAAKDLKKKVILPYYI